MSEKIYDARVIEHLVRRGELTQNQVQEFLAALDDDAEHGEETETLFEAHYALRAENAEAATAEDENAADIQEN